MGFEIPNPDEIIARALRMPRTGPRPGPAHPALPPEEEKSLLSDVLQSGIGGLQYIGETLDKPGRAVRGLLGGKPSELANLIPFSDTMGLTDPSKSVSGRDLLEQGGLLDKNTPGLDWGDVAGFGAEVLTDPTSFITGAGKALTGAGKVAKAVGISTKGAAKYRTLAAHLAENPHLLDAATEAAGKLGTTLDAVKGDKLGGLFGLTTGPLGLAGISKSSVPKIAQGPGAEAITGALGKASSYIGQTAPARGMKALFDHTVKGQLSGAGQDLARAQTAATEAARPQALKSWAKLGGDLSEIQKSYMDSFGSNPLPDGIAEKFENLARMHAEGVSPKEAFDFHGMPYHAPTGEALVKATQDFGTAKDDLWSRFLSLGGDSANLHETEALKHSPRYINPKGTNALEGIGYKGTVDSAKGRLTPTKFLPADVINAMYRDPDIAQWTGELSKKTGKEFALGEGIGKSEIPGLVEHWQGLGSQKPVGPGDLADVLKTKYGKWLNDAAVAEGVGPDEVAKNLAEHLTSRNKAVQFFTKTGQDLYGKLTPDSYKYMTEVSRSVANMAAIHDTLGKSLVPGGTPLAAVFKDAGMNPVSAMQTFTGRFGQLPPGMGVHPDVANAVLSVSKKTQSPEWMQAIGKKIDEWTRPIKQNLTLPFPSFASRNLLSGQAMNLFSNEVPDLKHLVKYGMEVNETRKILKDPAAYRGLVDELAAHRVFDQHDLATMGTELGWDVRRAPNAISPKGALENVKGGFANAQKLAATPVAGGIGERLPETIKAGRAVLGAPAQIGAEFNKQIEFLNRVPMYLYLRKHLGWTPEVAAQRVRELQVDYSALAPAEKAVMRRLVPFYSYTRKIIPELFKQLLDRPGGVQAQVVRASNTGRSKDEFVPPYVGEGMSVNLGGDKYLSSLGLPTDQYSDLFVKGPTPLGTIKRTGQKALSMMNPYLKGPLETVTGQNFFTGRPIEESFQHPTGSVLANQVLHNSPASRFITSARQLQDDRKSKSSKATNLLTGLRITDVSGGLDKQKRLAESKMLTEMLREHPDISSSTDVYPRKDPATGKPVQLSPEAERLYRAYMHLKAQGEQEAKKKRKQQAIMPVTP